MLAKQLPPVDEANAVVIALPRGGLPVAMEIASALHLPLDIALVRKVGVPGQPELAVGAVSDGDHMQLTINRDVAGMTGLSDADVRALAEKELPELERRRAAYCGDRPPIPVTGKTAIVVDDGVATGATMRSALRLIRERGASEIILALPVAPKDTLEDLRHEADQVVCLSTPAPFFAVGAHYADFRQTTDGEVEQILAEASRAYEAHRARQTPPSAAPRERR